MAASRKSSRVALLQVCSFAVLLLIGAAAALTYLSASIVGNERVAAVIVPRLRQVHAAVMTYLCLIPGIPAAIGGLILPKLVGQRCTATRLAWASLISYWGGAIVIVISAASGGIDDGISYFAHFSRSGPVASLGVAVGVFLVGLSCGLNGLHAIKNVRSLHSETSHWRHLPPLAFVLCVVGAIHLVLLPVQGLTVTLMLLERLGVHSFFDPSRGGDALLLRQMSWFYLHPLMLVAVLPALGLIGHVFDHHSMSKRSTRSTTLHAVVVFSILSFVSWGTHLIGTGQGALMSTLTSVFNMLLVLPLWVLFVNCLATVRCIRNDDCATVSLAATALLILGAGLLMGLVASMPGLNSFLVGSQFAVGQSHLVGSAICIVSLLAGIRFLWGGAVINKMSAFPFGIVATMTVMGLCMAFVVQLVVGIHEVSGRQLGEAVVRHSRQLFYSSLFTSGVGLFTIAALLVRGAFNKPDVGAQN